MTPCYTRHELAPGVHVDIPHEHEGVTVNKSMAEVLEELWEQGNCAGLDGWIGLGRGVREWDEEAVHIRRRDVAKTLDALTAAGFGPVKAAAAGALRDAADHAEAFGIESINPRALRNRAASIEAPDGP